MKLLNNLLNKKRIFTFAACGLLVFLTSCKSDVRKTVVIWTNRSEFIPYAEVFNTTQNKIKALVVYKENPADSLPSAKDEVPPDLVVGNLLRSEKKRRQFRSINYLFTTGELNELSFYKSLLDSCKKNDSYYQLPVSFNVPAIVYSAENSNLIPEDYMLTPDQIKNISASYNEKNKTGITTKIGFAPQWYPEFLYTLSRLQGANFVENGNTFSWDNEAIGRTVSLLREWTTFANGNAQEESDFEFKYLYTPPAKQIMTGHCLFAYMTSNELFSLSTEQLKSVDFRWIQENNKIPVEDSMITMGLYKKASHKSNAEEFLKWFFTETAQRKMIEHVHEMNLNTATFGIANGFSSLKDVNERVFPTYYISLLSNIPIGEYLDAPAILPLRWQSLKTRVVETYFKDAINAPEGSVVRSFEDRISEWSKQYF